jgi:transposase
MYLKVIRKYCMAEKRSVDYYRLSESYRDEFGFPRQRMIVSFGRLDELPDQTSRLLLCERVSQLLHGETSLYGPCTDPAVERLAQVFFKNILQKKKVDRKPLNEEGDELVKLGTLKHKDIREAGAESLCFQAFKQLGIGKFLEGRGWDKETIALAATHVIGRAVYPASELKTVSWIRDNSSVCDLTGYDREKVTKDKLYSVTNKLYGEKEGLENHLSRCTNELFCLEDKILLYDLTNTYFEGRMQSSNIAKFGRSKEKRADARLVVLAVVINPEGFLKYSDIFEGNTSDCATLQSMIETLDRKTGSPLKKPVVVMDAGIASDPNILYLKEKGYDYLCVSRSSLKQYKAQEGTQPVKVTDKKGQNIELLRARSTRNEDNYLWVKSYAKAEKEMGMHNQFTLRFEEGLRAIANGIGKKGGTKKLEKVWERIGRMKEKYPSVHQNYDITVSDNGNGTATSLSFCQKANTQAQAEAGVYFLRTSLDLDEKTTWFIYNAIREIEYTFRVLKTDLDLRPIYHKTDKASMAHLHLGLLAYWLVSTIRYQLKQKGYNHDWREIVRTMNTHKVVTSSVENDKGDIIQVRQCSEPTIDVRSIYKMLNYDLLPMPRKKSVWHTGERNKNAHAEVQFVTDR